jgi:hypothetical protein
MLFRDYLVFRNFDMSGIDNIKFACGDDENLQILTEEEFKA